MTKILLVEDDKNLREIYGTRLYAEGYDIVSAGDGEEALAMAVREKPDLIISDVMMPKISGFDMLDILRTSEDTKNIPVIMMTALSSEDQRARGESLGATRYLVKSQVGIEDVVRTVHDVLRDAPGMSPAPSAQQAPTSTGLSIPERQQPATQQITVQDQQQFVAPQSQQQYTAAFQQQAAPMQQMQPAPQQQQPPQIQQAPQQPSHSGGDGSLPRPIAPFSTQRPAGLGDRVIHPLEQSATNQPDNVAAKMAAALSGEPGQIPTAPAMAPQYAAPQQPTPQQEQPITAPQPAQQTTQPQPLAQQPQPAPQPPVFGAGQPSSFDSGHIELPSVEQFTQPQQQQPGAYQQPPEQPTA